MQVRFLVHIKVHNGIRIRNYTYLGSFFIGGIGMNDWNGNGNYDSADRYIDYKMSGGGSGGGSGKNSSARCS